jgi:hypothetical protein
MKSLIDIYNPSENFWELNPQFKTMSPFSELHKKDRKRTKLDSSKDMWFVSGILDKKSNYSDMEEDPEKPFGQYRQISRDLSHDENWLYDNYDRLRPYFEAWERFAITPAWRLMLTWEKKMKERDRVLSETPYEVGVTDERGRLVGSNVEILDKMFERSPKLWDQYIKTKELIEAEGAEGGVVKGDSVASASDLGEI